jgi:TfuA-like protein
MGALRAVECQPWGAEPVGEIAEWYASGQIEGDDEVCLAHGGEDTGYKAFSIPLVNVRATLAAVPSIMMSAARKAEVLEVAKAIFYPERTWRRLQDACELRDFDLEEYEVDLKQADAMQLCYLLNDLPPRKKPEREVRNAREGYAGVFRANDMKVFHHGKIHRLHEIAPDTAFTQRLALERKLALAFCELAGIGPREGFKADPESPLLDMQPDEMEELIKEEATLRRAREWLASSKANFGLVSHVNDWLRVHGLYEQRKEAL